VTFVGKRHLETVKALARYDRGRRRFGGLVVEHERRLGTYLEAQRKPPGGLTTVLRERGAAGVIDGAPTRAALA
jgi:hypothetical protein